MKITNTKTGKINVRATLMSMEAGDVISLKEDQISLEYTRTLASTLGRSTKRTFSVTSPKELNGKVVIKRID